MIDYNRYCDEKSLSNRDIINVISDEYPKFSKVQTTMIRSPEKYGVCLLPEAEALLVSVFGNGSGLNINTADSGTPAPEKKQPPNRKKKNRLIVRVNDELNNRIRDLMAEMKFYTVQDFLEAALLAMVEQNEDQDKDSWEKIR